MLGEGLLRGLHALRRSLNSGDDNDSDGSGRGVDGEGGDADDDGDTCRGGWPSKCGEC